MRLQVPLKYLPTAIVTLSSTGLTGPCKGDGPPARPWAPPFLAPHSENEHMELGQEEPNLLDLTPKHYLSCAIYRTL